MLSLCCSRSYNKSVRVVIIVFFFFMCGVIHLTGWYLWCSVMSMRHIKIHHRFICVNCVCVCVCINMCVCVSLKNWGPFRYSQTINDVLYLPLITDNWLLYDEQVTTFRRSDNIFLWGILERGQFWWGHVWGVITLSESNIVQYKLFFFFFRNFL